MAEPPSEERSGPGDPGADLAQELLHEPIPPATQPPAQGLRRWLRRAGQVLASLFVAYHATVLLVYNLPSGGLTAPLHRLANRDLGMATYFRVAGLTQGWGMFAPNPHRANIFMRVWVEDQDGSVHDMGLDVYGRRRHPYLFYDRMAKINRRLAESAGYRRPFAAWVCREWARTHGGRIPKRVSFERLWTHVPPPEKVYRFMYYDPRDLHLNHKKEESFRCATTRHGQLPPELRARYGLPPAGPEAPEFRDVSISTWWTVRQRARRKPGGGS